MGSRNGSPILRYETAIADLVPTKRLGFAFGLFNTGFGVFWFVGSALMGVLYDISVSALVYFPW